MTIYEDFLEGSHDFHRNFRRKNTFDTPLTYRDLQFGKTGGKNHIKA